MTSKNPTDFNKTLGAAVRKQRTIAGMSQSDVGSALGVTFQQVQKYEKGVNRISVETLIRIATAINATPGQLIEAAIEQSGADAAPIQRMTRLKLEAMRGLDHMTEPSQRVALDVINALKAGHAA